MSEPLVFDKSRFELVAPTNGKSGVPDPEIPFRILILGDFGRRGSRDKTAGEPQPVDRDNLDRVLGRLHPVLSLRLSGEGGPPVSVGFAQLDDFHPDRLYRELEVFENLRRLRRELAEPRTFDRAAREIAAWTAPDTGPPLSDPRQKTEAPAAATEPGATDASGLLDRVLDASRDASSRSRPPVGGSDWHRFLRRIVQPHRVPAADPQQSVLEAAVDGAATGLMRAILHHPRYQALESAWRGMDFLVRGLETDETLQMYLLDVPKPDLAEDLSGVLDLRESALYRILVEKAGETPWALVAGNYTFGADCRDAELLARIAGVAAAAGAPFIAAADSGLFGCKSLAQTPDPDEWDGFPLEDAAAAWRALRSLPQAGYVGLALPRFLLRLPYGARTDPLETFDFEEMENRPQHEQYLWGNPCFACSRLIGGSFQASGWALRPGSLQEIDGLPLHTYRVEDEYRNQPCAEVLLTERAAAAILESGLMPLLSFRDRDRVRLARVQSIADPLSSLAGPWG